MSDTSSEIMMDTKDPFSNRLLSEGFPGMDQLAHKAFADSVNSRSDDTDRVARILTYLGRLKNMSESNKVLVLGCGPYPEPMKILHNKGHSVVGVEPVPSFVETATNYMDGKAEVVQGTAEQIPLPDNSQDIVWLESVAEHVDSIRLSLEEMYRVLAPGGVLYLTTTNRHKFSIKGTNGEYQVPFYNWLPRLVKECYIHDHLHFRPHLASYSERPAVHWFSYQDLCASGRDAGFARFYSLVDLMRPDDKSITASAFRKRILKLVQRNAWIRALALTQTNGHIIMWKRN